MKNPVPFFSMMDQIMEEIVLDGKRGLVTRKGCAPGELISSLVFKVWRRPSCVGLRFWWSLVVLVEELGKEVEARS